MEVRVDARADRGVGTPTVRLQWGKTPSGRRFQESVSCRDDGADGDAVAEDRLWRCHGTVTGTGEGRLMLVDGAGGENERLLDEIAVTLVPGRSLRWTWTGRPQAWPAKRLADDPGNPLQGKTAEGEDALLAAFAEGSRSSAATGAPGLGGGMPEAPTEGGGGPGGGPHGPGGQRLTQRIALPLSYETPGRVVKLPRSLEMPEWPALVAVPAAVVGIAAARRAFGAILVLLARSRRRSTGV